MMMPVATDVPPTDGKNIKPSGDWLTKARETEENKEEKGCGVYVIISINRGNIKSNSKVVMRGAT